MLIKDHLWDLQARTLSLGRDMSEVVDGLLRLQNAKEYQRPITLYVVGTSTQPPLNPSDAIMVCSLLRVLRSPVTTIGLGHLSNTQALVVTSGTGRRYLLKHAIISLAPIQWIGDHRPIGLQADPAKPDVWLDQTLASFLSELKLNPSLFQAERLISAEHAVELRLADEVVNTLSMQKKANHELEK